MPLVFSFLKYFRSPGIAAELRAVITARGSRYLLVRAAWPTAAEWAAVCGFYYFYDIFYTPRNATRSTRACAHRKRREHKEVVDQAATTVRTTTVRATTVRATAVRATTVRRPSARRPSARRPSARQPSARRPTSAGMPPPPQRRPQHPRMRPPPPQAPRARRGVESGRDKDR